MSIPKGIMNSNKYLGDRSILLAYRGSIAHGMYIPNSDPNSIDDKDIMGVCVPSVDYYFGIEHDFPFNGTQEIKKDEWDSQILGINLYKINKVLKDKEIAVVPGKVLSLGEFDKKNTVAAFQFSDTAKSKINKTGKAISIKELIKDNPKGKLVRIVGW